MIFLRKAGASGINLVASLTFVLIIKLIYFFNECTVAPELWSFKLKATPEDFHHL